VSLNLDVRELRLHHRRGELALPALAVTSMFVVAVAAFVLLLRILE